MPSRKHRRQWCRNGKFIYATEAEAQAAAEQLERDQPLSFGRLEAHRCREGLPHYHVGHSKYRCCSYHDSGRGELRQHG